MSVKNVWLKAILCLIVMIAVSLNVYPAIFSNGGDCQFEPGCDPDGGSSLGVYMTADSRTIGVYIVWGAGHILNAQSGAAAYLNRVETASLYGTDFYEQRETLYTVIMEMERAKAVYEAINELAAVTPYKKSSIEKLLAFDYDSFCEREGLNPYIFERVKAYLGKGDVRGFFARVSKDADVILDQLYSIKEVLEADKSPGINTAWKLNQTFFDYVLMGQYAAQVFSETQ